jgi:hypothetical protein
MKKVLVLLSVLFLALSVIKCSGVQKPDPKVIACKAGCDTTFDSCIKKAVKNEAKKAACEAVKSRCYSDCEK